MSNLLDIKAIRFGKPISIRIGTKMNFQTAANNKVEATKEDTINIHDARELLGSKLFAKIMLDQETYLLKITKQNKLILTK